MIRDKLPPDINFVPPLDTLVDCIATLELQAESHGKLLENVLRKLVDYRARVDKIQEDFDLLKGYLP